MRRFIPLGLILALALFIRLVHIDHPTIGAHQWRQSQTAMVSVNFYENGFNFLYPQIDWAGDAEGYAETEFPVYSYIVALGYRLFGEAHWVGRLTSVIFSLFTIVFVYLLARKHIDERAGLWSAFVLALLPLFAFYGRAVMPESLMLMASAGGIYFFSEWLSSARARFFILSFVFISTACLIKPTSLYLGLPLLFLASLKWGWAGTVKRGGLWLFSALVLASVFAWYYHAHGIFQETGLSIGLYDKWLNWELLIKPKFWDRILIKSLLERHFAWGGFFVLAAGLLMKRVSKEELLFDYWILAVFIYTLIAGRGNMAHDYYQLPFTLPGAVIIGKVLGRHLDSNGLRGMGSKLLAFALAGFIVMSAVQYYKFLKKEDAPESATYRLSQSIREKTGEGSLLLTITDGDPSVLYLSHRQGWIRSVHQMDPRTLDELASKGLDYIGSAHWRFEKEENKKILEFLKGRYNTVYDDGVVFILGAAPGTAK